MSGWIFINTVKSKRSMSKVNALINGNFTTFYDDRDALFMIDVKRLDKSELWNDT